MFHKRNSRLGPSRLFMLVLLWEKQRATKSRGDDLSRLHGLEFYLHIVGGKLLLWRHGHVVRKINSSWMIGYNSNLPRISEAAILWTARNYGRVGEGTNFKEFRSHYFCTVLPYFNPYMYIAVNISEKAVEDSKSELGTEEKKLNKKKYNW